MRIKEDFYFNSILRRRENLISFKMNTVNKANIFFPRKWLLGKEQACCLENWDRTYLFQIEGGCNDKHPVVQTLWWKLSYNRIIGHSWCPLGKSSWGKKKIINFVDSKDDYFSRSVSLELVCQKASPEFPWPKYYRTLQLEHAFSTVTENLPEHCSSVLNIGALSITLASLRSVSHSSGTATSPTELVMEARNGKQWALCHGLKFWHVASSGTASCFSQKTNPEAVCQGHLRPQLCLIID